MSKVRSRGIWKQMVRDKFLWVVGLTVSVTMIYSIAPTLKDIIN